MKIEHSFQPPMKNFSHMWRIMRGLQYIPHRGIMQGMKSLAFVLILVILSFASFSVAVMTNDAGGHQGGCIGSLVNSVDCPLSSFSTAVHHISAYNSIAQTPLQMIGLIALVLLLLFSYVPGIWHTLLPALQPARTHFRQALRPRLDYATTRWLARLENSPTVRCSA